MKILLLMLGGAFMLMILGHTIGGMTLGKNLSSSLSEQHLKNVELVQRSSRKDIFEERGVLRRSRSATGTVHEWSDRSGMWLRWQACRNFIFVFVGDGDGSLARAAAEEALDILNVRQQRYNIIIVREGVKYRDSFSIFLEANYLDTGASFFFILQQQQQGGAASSWKKYVQTLEPNSPLTAESIVKLAEALEHGDLKPYLRNEELPLIGAEGLSVLEEDGTRAINAAMFSQMVNQRDNTGGEQLLPVPDEYVVVFHAPWCGHCRKFAAEFEPIATSITRALRRRKPQKGGKQMGFFKLDVVANDVDHPNLQINTVPAIYLFNKEDPLTPKRFFYRTNSVFADFKAFLSRNSLLFTDSLLLDDLELDELRRRRR